jgi:pimeloyl-ACP methyl ester carboxylesterase
MLRRALRSLRYARTWKTGAGVACSEIGVERDGVPLPATFATPTSHRGRLPGWIVLGGITSMGRFHPQLSRFAHALAASGAGVVVPEIPEWTDLRLAPRMTVPTVRAAVRVLDECPEVEHGRYGLIGFSFGAPQVVIASRHPDLADRIAGVVSFGGYCDLERTLRCQLTGLHEWRGTTERIDPDPYGRWVVASNYLTGVAGCEEAGDVADALRRMALAATRRRRPGWDPVHDALKVELRAALPASRQPLFDLLAPPAGTPLPISDRSEALATGLAGACRRKDPLLDPVAELHRTSVPVHLVHGRGDRLVPYTESLRFRELLPDTVAREVTVTGLFAHSAEHRPAALLDRVREGIIYLGVIQRLLGLVDGGGAGVQRR